MSEKEEDIWEAFERVLKEHGHPLLGTNKTISLDTALLAIDLEPELPGAIPPEMFNALKAADEDTMAEALRIIVRETKRGIRERLLNHD